MLIEDGTSVGDELAKLGYALKWKPPSPVNSEPEIVPGKLSN